MAYSSRNVAGDGDDDGDPDGGGLPTTAGPAGKKRKKNIITKKRNKETKMFRAILGRDDKENI